MLPLLPVRDATSDKGAKTGGVVSLAIFDGLPLAAAIIRGGWIDKGMARAVHSFGYKGIM